MYFVTVLVSTFVRVLSKSNILNLKFPSEAVIYLLPDLLFTGVKQIIQMSVISLLYPYITEDVLDLRSKTQTARILY
jgi:hypothetical protein